MSADVTYEIDVLALAQSALSDRRRLEAITRAELVALLGFVLQQNGEPVDHLGVEFGDVLALASVPQQSELPASLAASVALLIRANDRLAALRQAAIDHPVPGEPFGDLIFAIETLNDAFRTLKTRFEKEFPHAVL